MMKKPTTIQSVLFVLTLAVSNVALSAPEHFGDNVYLGPEPESVSTQVSQRGLSQHTYQIHQVIQNNLEALQAHIEVEQNPTKSLRMTESSYQFFDQYK